MTDFICKLAREQGVLDRVIMTHADLGRVEWKGTRELAEEHARHYGIRFMAVKRTEDLLQQVEKRGRWPDSQNRYCTSDHKRDQIAKLHTAMTTEMAADRQITILNCMGIRRDESLARSKKEPFTLDTRGTNGKRKVFIWYPIFEWTVAEVWATIKASGVKHHPAYDLGMPRLSCCFCIFAPKAVLMVAGKHNPELLDEYCRVEVATGHDFRHNFKIAEVRDAIARGEQPGPITTWSM